MLVKFKRRHRFFKAGEVREVPDHIGLKYAQTGIVTIIKKDHGPLKPSSPENKAIQGSQRPPLRKGRSKKKE